MIQFNTSEEYILEDERVLLRSVVPADLQFLYPYIHDKEIWTFSLVKMEDTNDMDVYFKKAFEKRGEGVEYPFIVFDKLTAQYVGSTRYYEICLSERNIKLGFTWYGRSHWGSGVNNHCKFLLLQFAFEEIGIERVEFGADSRNLRSIAAMKKIGCKVEGVLRSHKTLYDGTRRDTTVLSIIRKEWFESVKNNLEMSFY